ncbi:hypothetical protein E4A47_10350 [Micrococcus flavus]|uniref:Uncharacterized protein n=1 Tax=Micrococcus flavus TaxID=384602 RepID=A0A4Y8WW27_9MICC|nr:hypothetical protein [Micrococcus flavus]MBB4883968.1 hypothetical protein [Micrococcus flavus]TFH99378.1 hypothetical protein E4A47_10350 [Micrococcus flavus]GGK54277.1 hypothetical protein GCM10007073_21710 [Micrococcus flavus]
MTAIDSRIVTGYPLPRSMAEAADFAEKCGALIVVDVNEGDELEFTPADVREYDEDRAPGEPLEFVRYIFPKQQQQRRREQQEERDQQKRAAREAAAAEKKARAKRERQERARGALMYARIEALRALAEHTDPAAIAPQLGCNVADAIAAWLYAEGVTDAAAAWMQAHEARPEASEAHRHETLTAHARGRLAEEQVRRGGEHLPIVRG